VSFAIGQQNCQFERVDVDQSSFNSLQSVDIKKNLVKNIANRSNEENCGYTNSFIASINNLDNVDSSSEKLNTPGSK
jgi:hypothetical protein